MNVTHDEIVSRVMTAMQEMANPQEEGLSLVSDDRLRLDDYVSAAVASGVSAVMSTASGVNVLSLSGRDGVSYSAGEVRIEGPLRDRYVKLYRLRLSGWKRPASTGVAEDSQTALCQYNPFTTAGPDKPVVVEHKSPDAVVLSCYPREAGSGLEDLIAEASYDPAEGLHALDARFEQAVVYATAAWVYNEMGMPDAGGRMTDAAMSVSGLTKTGQ